MNARTITALLLAALPCPLARAQIGGEFRVNTYTTGDQYLPQVAADASGNFVVVWMSWQDGDLQGIFGQRFDAVGATQGGEFQVNIYTPGRQFSPAVAMDAGGGFVVAWSSDFEDGSEIGVFARRFDASGVPLGAEFRVNSYTTGYQLWPSIAMGQAGAFVVVWTTVRPNAARDVAGQRFDALGNPRGSEFIVNTYTTSYQQVGVAAANPSGDFVVAWRGYEQDGSNGGVFAQLYDATGAARGSEFLVNTFTTGSQSIHPAGVAWLDAGRFVIVWQSYHQDGDSWGVFGQRFDASGARIGGEFRANTHRLSMEGSPAVAVDGGGQFAVVWYADVVDDIGFGVFGQRFDGAGAARGTEFRANSYTTDWQFQPAVAALSDRTWITTWSSFGQDGSRNGVYGRRLASMLPALLAVDTAAGPSSDGNRILEPGEAIDVRPSWYNWTRTAQMLDGAALSFAGPPPSANYQLLDGAGAYGTIPDGATVACTDCYRVAVGLARPAVHWDAALTEEPVPNAVGETKPWRIHIGESFADVPRTSTFYRFVETLLHGGITGGCAPTQYCPRNDVTRDQMAVFTLEAREGAGYRPLPCGATAMFADVPVSSFFCSWIEELARRGVVAGCGGGNYCPAALTSREQIPVFVLRLLEPTLVPPPCTIPLFADVPASSPYCRWIEELARRGVIIGCGGGNYCPTAPVTREQMAVFISVTYGLTLYGP